MSDVLLPYSMRSGLKSKYGKYWKQAYDKEIGILRNRNTWKIVPCPKDIKVISCKMVSSLKTSPTGKVVMFKGRLVGRGNEQMEYGDTYAPVIRDATLRMLLIDAAINDSEIESVDFVASFPNGKLDGEQIFMEQPQGYEDLSVPDGVCQLLLPLYGIKEAANKWYAELDKSMRDLGLLPLESELCVWTSKTITVLAHVDDCLIIGKKTPVEQFKK